MNQKFLTTKAELVIRVLASTSEQPHTKTVGDEATTSGIGKKWRHQYNEYSAKERVDIGKYASENGVTKACRHFISEITI